MPSRNSNDLQISMALTFEEILLGVNKTIQYKRKERCTNCKKDDGVRRHCNACKNLKYIMKELTVELKIPPGVRDNMTISMKDKGHQVLDTAKNKGLWEKLFGKEEVKSFGTLHIQIAEKPHPVFKRSGIDLSLDLPITIEESRTGAVREITLLNGNSIKIEVPTGITDRKILRLQGKGFPNLGDEQVGDLYIQIKVK